MATKQQAAANRRNAAQSTGPRSAEGKARSAANSMKHGIYASREIIEGEKLSDRHALETLYFERWQPSTPEQVMQVRILIRCDWEDTRYSKATAQLWDYTISRLWRPEDETLLGNALLNHERTFARLERLRDLLNRTYNRAVQELERLQALPSPETAHPEPAQPVVTKTQTQKLASFRQMPSPPPVPPIVQAVIGPTDSPGSA